MSGIETFDELNKKELACLEKIIDEICVNLNIGKDRCISALEKSHPYLISSYKYTKARALTSGEILRHPQFKKYTSEVVAVVSVFIEKDDCTVITDISKSVPETIDNIINFDTKLHKKFLKLPYNKKIEVVSSLKKAVGFFMDNVNDEYHEIKNCYIITQTDVSEDFTNGTVIKDYKLNDSEINKLVILKDGNDNRSRSRSRSYVSDGSRSYGSGSDE
jgi:hypothetical protein